MDKVRLGRALGYGARHAAKTLSAVADAAAAPDPRSAARAPQEPASPPAAVPSQAQIGSPRRVPSGAQVRSAGGAIWRPLATYSGALSLRVTGVFFAVIALAMGNGAWRLREQLNFSAPGSQAMRHFWFFLAFGVLFGYFAVSSFARARRRERRG